MSVRSIVPGRCGGIVGVAAGAGVGLVLDLLMLSLLEHLPCLQHRLVLSRRLARVMTIVAPVVLVMPNVAWFTLMTRSTGRSTVTNGTGRLVVVNNEAVATAVALGMFMALTEIRSASIMRNRHRVGEQPSFRVRMVNIVSSTGYMLVYLGTLRPVFSLVMNEVTLFGMLVSCSR